MDELLERFAHSQHAAEGNGWCCAVARQKPNLSNWVELLGLPNIGRRSLVVAAVSLIFLYYIHLYSFLLFHVLVEIFSVMVAFAIFMFAWNTRENIHNSSLTLLGAAYLTIGALDLLHTFSYKGMGVFQSYGANTATQLWIAARYIEGITLAVAPVVAARKFTMDKALIVYLSLFGLVLATVFFRPVFPTCFVEGVGLTPFKKISEYIIAVILVAALVALKRHRQYYDAAVFKLLAASIAFTIVSEMMSTFYISVYGVSNLMGHVFKLVSFWLIYKAIIETGLRQPFSVLFRELANSERRFRDLVDTLPTGICEVDPDWHITYINPAGRTITGYEAQDFRAGVDLGRLLMAKDFQKKQKRLTDLLQGRPIDSTEYHLVRKDGSRADVIVNSTPIYRNGLLTSVQTSLIDVTELNHLKNDLQQAQKMESIAILAGGMAHRINNMLMGVVGRLEILKLKAGNGEAATDKAYEEVLQGCERIASLIKQLLAYSRGGQYQTEAIDLNAFIKKYLAGIRGNLKPEVRLGYTLKNGRPEIVADARQLQIVVSEVVTNALEAVDSAGAVDISLELIQIDSEACGKRPGMAPGPYALLCVRDSGVGMADDVLARIYEPFYSTKFQGRGLGMAAVYGIVKNHGGWIDIDSRPDQGTVARIWLPAPGPEASRSRRQPPA